MYRRQFLLTLSAAALRGAAKPLRGIFPIVQTPFTDSNQLDTKTLADEIKFLGRGRIHGVVWPQMASEWTELTPEERATGAEVIMSAAKGTGMAVVIGVQGPGIDSAVRYAKYAERLGPDAIIAIPPRDPLTVADYYRAIGRASTRPLFVQAIGDMSVDFLLQMAKEIPTLRYVKDEAGHTLSRITKFRKMAPEMQIFSGAHGKTLLDEMDRGAAGSMPAASFADLYVRVWDDWRAGLRDRALESFSRIALLVHQMEAYGLPALKYILHLRGVFPNWNVRGKEANYFDAAAQKTVKTAWEWTQRSLSSGVPTWSPLNRPSHEGWKTTASTSA